MYSTAALPRSGIAGSFEALDLSSAVYAELTYHPLPYYCKQSLSLTTNGKNCGRLLLTLMLWSTEKYLVWSYLTYNPCLSSLSPSSLDHGNRDKPV